MIKNILEYITDLWYPIIEKKYKESGGAFMNKINLQLEQKATNVLISNDMLKLPVDLVKIADNYNIEVYEEKLPQDISGAIKYDIEEEKFKILLDKEETSSSKRFTLAHELAHYFLAEDTLKSELHFDTLYKKVNDDSEYDVDYLASALLINKDLLESAYKITDSISVLSKVFDVSESVMTLRLITLGLI